MSERNLKALFTGNYLPDYNRTRIIRKGLTLSGCEVVDFPFSKKNSETKLKLKELAEGCDFIFMPSFTHQQVEWVKRVLPKYKLIFDPLISRHLTRIYDYKLALPFGLSALRNYYRDKRSMRAADFVVTDTEAHRQYFHKKFKIPLEKMGVLYIGNDFDMYAPKGHGGSGGPNYVVGFYGGFIPLQGTMNILEAAYLLRDQAGIRFEMVGTGFEFEKAKSYVSAMKLKNVNLPGWLDEKILADRICEWDLCLGIFGDTLKSDLVIPNKVYHYAACARPILTKDSPAVREIFNPGQDIYLCGTKPQEIADAILRIRGEREKAEQVAQVAHANLVANFSCEMIGEKLLGYVKL